jgi:hypothetical protein
VQIKQVTEYGVAFGALSSGAARPCADGINGNKHERKLLARDLIAA